jgi:predicted acyltransferase
MNRHLTFRTGLRPTDRDRSPRRGRHPGKGHRPLAAPDVDQPAGAPRPVRLRSIDVLRGLTVALMVIVNNPGDWNNVYAPFLHAEWNGWTPTDLVFPFFLFIVGVSITLSPAGLKSTAGILRRGAVIFGLGLFLAGFPYFRVATWRIPGVLARIALCYVAAAFITRATASKDDDVRAQLWRVASIAAALVIAYAVLMRLVPVPGGHAGDLSPAGNLGAWLDRTLMRGHLWRAEWDPEGLLSSVPAVATTLLGVVAGLALRIAPSLGSWRRQLVAAGLVCAAFGLLWNPSFPINKSLWTSSYVLFTGGLAAIALALCSLWTDEKHTGFRITASEPFVALGRNALLLFVLSGLVGRLLSVITVDPAAGLTLKSWIYDSAFSPFASPKNASLLFAAANLALLYALLAWLHARRWYWRA